MALINCPECQDKISNRALVCVHCGFPLKEFLSEQVHQQEQNALKTLLQENKSLHGINKGKIIQLGSYFQESDTSQKQPIDWIVLETRGEYSLLISEKCLDVKPYNDIPSSQWKGSSIQRWLNNDFWEIAFTSIESLLICKIEEIQNCFHEYAYDIEMDDKIFLPSPDETDKYSTFSVFPTPYVETLRKCVLYIPYWLRCTKELDAYAYTADGFQVNRAGEFVKQKNIGVRPCIWVKIPKDI